jgi:predicted  nucleic acid-binding Zn-ribbon protein
LEVKVEKQIEVLAKIQEKDQALEELRRKAEEGPKRIIQMEGKMEDLEQHLEEGRNRIQETRKMQRQYEMEVEEGVERIKKSRTRLLTIKNNKEYQAVLKEIEETGNSNSDKEDKILGCMEEMEKLEQVLRDTEKDVSDTRERFRGQMKDIQEEVDQARAQILKEEEERKGMVETIDLQVLSTYEHLRRLLGGLAIAQVENATCSGCNLSIPPQMYNELQKGDSLRFCPNCERIIYWKGGNGAVVSDMSE